MPAIALRLGLFPWLNFSYGSHDYTHDFDQNDCITDVCCGFQTPNIECGHTGIWTMLVDQAERESLREG